MAILLLQEERQLVWKNMTPSKLLQSENYMFIIKDK